MSGLKSKENKVIYFEIKNSFVQCIDFKGFEWCPEVGSNHRHKDFQFFSTLSLKAITTIANGKNKVKKNHNAFD